MTWPDIGADVSEWHINALTPPRLFGIAKLPEDGKKFLLRVEKPKEQKPILDVMGVHRFNPPFFSEVLVEERDEDYRCHSY